MSCLVFWRNCLLRNTTLFLRSRRYPILLVFLWGFFQTWRKLFFSFLFEAIFPYFFVSLPGRHGSVPDSNRRRPEGAGDQNRRPQTADPSRHIRTQRWKGASSSPELFVLSSELCCALVYMCLWHWVLAASRVGKGRSFKRPSITSSRPSAAAPATRGHQASPGVSTKRLL